MKKLVLFWLVCMSFAIATNAQITRTITKVYGTRITIPAYDAGDTLRITNDTLQKSTNPSNDDWVILKTPTKPYHLKLETQNKLIPKNGLYNDVQDTVLLSAYLPNIVCIDTAGFCRNRSLHSVYAPNLTTIKGNAFQGCTALQNIDLSKVTSMGEVCFSECLLKKVNIPLVKTIPVDCFSFCRSLDTVFAPAADTVLINAFGLSGLKVIFLPNVQLVDKNVFQGSQIEYISLPKVKQINDNAFKNCKNLKAIALGNTIPVVSTNTFSTASSDFVFYVPLGSLAAYRNSAAAFWNIFPDSRIQSAQTAAQEAYLYGLPLVLMDISCRQMTNTVSAANGKAPINQFAHNTVFPDANFRAVVRPNNDTYYSTAWLDLTAEPMVLSMPSTNGRYHLMPMLDAYTNVFASPGSRTTGNNAKTFLIAGPDWTGSKPAGVDTVLKAPTNRVWIAGRTQVNSADDGQNTVAPLMQQYDLRPLSELGNSSYVPPAGSYDPTISTDSPNDMVANMPIDVYFNYLNQLLAKNPPPAADSSFLKMIGYIGIGAGKTFDLSVFSAEEQDSLRKVPVNMLNLLKGYKAPTAKTANNWTYSLDTLINGKTIGLGKFGTADTLRAQTAFFGLGANLAEDAVYFSCEKDNFNQPLQGTGHTYILNIPKGSQPPVNAFWSLTLYDKDGYFCANDSNRYALGDRNVLDTCDDGSINIYIQNENPGGKYVRNWLPAPNDNFNLMIRAYYPQNTILTNQWKPNVVKKSFPVEITANDSSKGIIPLYGKNLIMEGRSAVCRFLPKAGYRIDSLLVNGVNVPDSIAGGCYTFSNVAAAHAVRVVFTGVPTLVVANKNVVYNGQPQGMDSVKIKLNNIEIGENNWVTYQYFLNGSDFGGKPTNAGTYKVIARFAGNDTLAVCQSDSVTLTITPKPITVTASAETIDYGQTPVLAYTVSPALMAGDTLSGALAVDNLNVGTHTIIQGNLSAGSNYAITYTSAILTVRSVNIDIHNIAVNGQTAALSGNNHYVVMAPCGENSVNITVNSDSDVAVKINGMAQNPYTVNLSNNGDNIITIVVTAQNGNSKTCTLTINKPLPLQQVVVTRWNNTLTVINNPAENGGYSFTSYQWYRNGEPLSAGQSWSAGSQGEALNNTDKFYVALTAEGISGKLQTCESSVGSRPSSLLKVYPNPVTNQCFIEHTGARIEKTEVIDNSGRLVFSTAENPLNTGYLVQGIYLLRIYTENGIETVKIIKE